jgi:molybdenum cofactor synthesis domain-containing protein
MCKTAGIIIIGNEILSGRTRDRNAYWLARQFHSLGIALGRISVVPDIIATIVTEVRLFSESFDYILVCGGIGPTPDDLTRQSVSQAFGLACVPHPEALQLLKDFYGERCTEGRLTMAELPENARLIHNPVTKAPGFQVQNVYVLPGIPELVEAMFPGIAAQLEHADLYETEFTSTLGESDFADLMVKAMELFPDVDFGSYPSIKNDTWRCSLVVKGYSQPAVAAAENWLQTEIAKRTEVLK